jgi:chemotaxis protein histidine kinase CheA
MNDFENEIKLQTIGELKNSLEDYDLWLLDLDSQIDTEAIEHVLRIVHSLKGNSKAADFADLSEGCHVLEDYLVAYQSGLKVKNDHRQIFFLLEKFHTSFEINLQKVEVGESSFLKDDVEDLILTINNRSNLSLVDHQVQNNKLESNELLKVLLVDDDPELREIIDYIIKLNWKAEVVLAENGKIGLEMTRE